MLTLGYCRIGGGGESGVPQMISNGNFLTPFPRMPTQLDFLSLQQLLDSLKGRLCSLETK